MKRNANLASLAFWIALAVLVGGCAGTPEATVPAVRKPSARINPCAERLHDVCGQLLLYHSLHNRLPRTLDELKDTGFGQMPELTCPVSGKPYIYNPKGLRIPGQPGRVVLYDATPCHSGMRWGILVGDPVRGKALTAKVVLLPDESVFSASQ